MRKNYKKLFIKNNLWVTFSHMLVYAKGIILLPLLIKNFGISMYGAYSLLLGYTGLIYGISSFGVGFRFQRFMPSTTDSKVKVKLYYPQFYFQFLSIIVISFILFLFNNYFKSTFIKDKFDYSFLVILGILLAHFFYAQTTDYFRYTHRIKYFAIPVAINPYLNIFLIILGIYLYKNIDINFLFVTSIFSMLILSIPLFYFIIKEIGFVIPIFKFKDTFEDLKLGLPIMLSYVVDFIISGSDRFVIGYFMTTLEVGYYNPAYTLGSLVIMIPKVMGVVLPPLLCKAVDDGQDQTASQLLTKSVRIYIILAIPFIVGGFVLSKLLLTFLANKEIAEVGFIITPIIALGILFYGITIILAYGVAFVKMRTKLILYSNLIAGFLNITLNIIFVYFFRSIIVVAIVSLISYFTSFMFLRFNTRNLIQIEFDKIFIVKTVIASLLMGLFLYFSTMFVTPFLIIVIVIPVSMLIYVSIVILLKTVEKSEIDFLKSFLKLSLNNS